MTDLDILYELYEEDYIVEDVIKHDHIFTAEADVQTACERFALQYGIHSDHPEDMVDFLESVCGMAVASNGHVTVIRY